MASSSPCPPTDRPGKGAAAAPPPSSLRIADPLLRGGDQQRSRGSTAQDNLRKIISIIATVFPPPLHPNAFLSELPPPLFPPLSHQMPLERGEKERQILSAPPDRHGMRIDLRLRLGPPWEVGRRCLPDEEEDHDAGLPSSACSFVGEGTTKLTGMGSSGGAGPETAESEIVTASYDGVHGPGMLDSNYSGQRSSEGEWDASEEGAEQEQQAKEAGAEKGEEEPGGDGEREGRPCSEITNIQRSAAGGGTDESHTVRGNNLVVTEEEVGMEKERSDVDGCNEGDVGRRCRRRRDEGYLGVLLEAVRQVSGGLLGAEGPQERAERNRKVAAAAFEQYEVAGEEEQALGPVVRSKRGRNQALPSRYRDSVLEPWRKPSGGGAGQRRQARTAR